MDPAVLRSLQFSVLVPAGVALAVLIPAWWARRGRPDADAFDPTGAVRLAPGERTWAAPLAFGISAAIVHAALFRLPDLPPASAQQWLFPIIVVATLIGLLAAPVRFRPPVRWAFRVVLVSVLGVLATLTLIRNAWTPLQAVAMLAPFVALTIGCWFALERLADRTRGLAAPGVALIAAGAASQVLVVGMSSLSLAQSAGVLAAVAGATAGVAFLRPRLTLALGGLHVPAILVGIYLLQGVALTNQPNEVPMAILVMLIAPAALLADVGPLARLSPMPRLLARLGLASLPAAAALGFAAANFFAAANEPY